MKTITALFLLFTTFSACLAQGPPADRQQFIRAEAPVIALTHVRVIDGTGAAPVEDQTIVIADGKIQSITATATATVPTGAQILDLKNYTVLPGLVGMHDHMFFPMGGNPPMYSNMGTSFPRLYLALGVTVSILLQALINMSVVLDMAPTKGFPLPMISFGGSSLLSTLASLGMLLSVSEHEG